MNNDQIISKALQILEERIAEYKTDTFFTSPKMTHDFLTLRLGLLEHEEFHVLYLNNQHALIRCECAFKGTIDGASVYPREIVKRALQLNAAAVIFAHNHPSGVTAPSEADKQITARLKQGLQLVDIRVLDHLIVAGNKSISFAERGIL